MNIALVIFRAEADRGGAERYVRDLSVSLLARGHQVTVLATSGAAVDGASFARIGAGGMTRTARYRRFCANLEKHLSTNRYDIVHACLPVPRCDVYHAHAGLESISLRDGHLRETTLTRQVTSKLSNQFNRKRNAFARVESALITSSRPPTVICLSNRERDDALLMFPNARDQFVTLYSLPDNARFKLKDVAARRKSTRKQLALTDDQTMFVFIGNDFERKGLSTAIRALGAMPDHRATLLVVGEGDQSRYTSIALRAGAMGRVLFVGKTDQVADFLSAADALVLPSHAEPFGMVTVEAILMGVPPIVSAIAGSSEIVDHERNGFVIDDVNDVAAWSAAMTKLTDRATRDAFSEACLAQRARFDYEQHVDAIEAIYAVARNNTR